MKIIFDIGGVCLSDYWGREERNAFSKEFNIDREKLWEYHKVHIDNLNTGQLSEKEYFDELIEKFGLQINSDKAISFLRNRMIPYSKVLNLINQLKEKYELYALTNEIKEAAYFKIKKFNLNNYFKKIFISSEMGLQKTDKRIYEKIIEDLNTNPSELLFIDNREDLLLPAKELGINTIHFKNYGQLQRDIQLTLNKVCLSIFF